MAKIEAEIEALELRLMRAWLAGAYVGFTELIAMRLRQVPYGMVVDARITAKKAGIEIPINDIEAHFLAGGNVIPTIQALIAAQKAGIVLDWNRACAIDLAVKGTSKTVLSAVRMSLYRWRGFGPMDDFVGLDNYRRVLTDDGFTQAVTHNLANGESRGRNGG